MRVRIRVFVCVCVCPPYLQQQPQAVVQAQLVHPADQLGPLRPWLAAAQQQLAARQLQLRPAGLPAGN